MTLAECVNACPKMDILVFVFTHTLRNESFNAVVFVIVKLSIREEKKMLRKTFLINN